MPYKCFLVEGTDSSMLYLRRYCDGPCSQMAGEHSYHNAMFLIGEVQELRVPCEHESCPNGHLELPKSCEVTSTDPRWPSQCECGVVFGEGVTFQHFTRRLYRNPETGEKWEQAKLPVGAMYFDDWMPRTFWWDNFQGQHLHVITPGGEWNIDSRCSNCTLPNDRTHRCWVRHGAAPNIHVDKNGHTCSAGAGSIVCGKYHGFLHNGFLTDGC
jgi:hypothetical protein